VKIEYAAPFVMMVLSAAASVIYVLVGDYRRAIYWAAAVFITGSVTL
jgi:hypothetical protein